MFSSILVYLQLTSLVAAVYQGFNYGPTFSDGSAKALQDFSSDFSTAQTLTGQSSTFTSARLFTMIQAGTSDSITDAIQAAINTDTSLLLGLWASAGQAQFSLELSALEGAINEYGLNLVNRVVGISVGSEDLYRISPLDTDNQAGFGAQPDEIISYINQTRSLIANTSANQLPIGHSDTWTAWVNSSNSAVIDVCDFLGTDIYPYFQDTEANSINLGQTLFFEAYNATVAAANGKSVWITETGWPVSGPISNQAVPNLDNARIYWDQVGCAVFGQINTWWYTLQDAAPTTPSPSFGVVGSDLSSSPLYDLSCGNQTTSASTTASSTTSSSSSLSGSLTSSTPTSSSSGSSMTPTASSSTSSTCPTTLSGPFEFPHLIIPINQSEPDHAAGTSYDGQFSSSVSSIYNFDISESNKICSLAFLFPNTTQMPSASFSLVGTGGILVTQLTQPATSSTTWNNAPPAAEVLGSIDSFVAGNTYVITSFPCPVGQTIGIEIAATGTLNFEYFQNYGAPGIGLYIIIC